MGNLRSELMCISHVQILKQKQQSETETDMLDMGQAKSIWGRELCQALTRWRRRTPYLQLLGMPCPEQTNGVNARL